MFLDCFNQRHGGSFLMEEMAFVLNDSFGLL